MIAWVAHLGAAAMQTDVAAQAALSAGARRAAPGRVPAAAPMIDFVTRVCRAAEPALSEAGLRDAAAFAPLHARLVPARLERGRVRAAADGPERHCRTAQSAGRKLAGFILSRLAADEAEILSIAVAAARRGRGLGGRLLDLHLRRLAGLGAKAVFLEVDEDNTPARRLYAPGGLSRGRAPRGLLSGSVGGRPRSALVLRRDLA